jgi:hypothetical protein
MSHTLFEPHWFAETYPAPDESDVDSTVTVSDKMADGGTMVVEYKVMKSGTFYITKAGKTKKANPLFLEDGTMQVNGYVVDSIPEDEGIVT